jgi:predicted PurR-regulated permease PerM
MTNSFNNRLRQVILLATIILLALLLLKELYVFLPGVLGALTLYILLRKTYFTLTIQKRWNKILLAYLFIFASMILIAIPIYFSIQLISNKISYILNNPADILAKAAVVGKKIESVTGITLITPENTRAFQMKAGSIVPGVLNSSLNILSNFLIMFFVLYFLLISGKEFEKALDKSIPLKEENVQLLGNDTINMIRANAIGIPILAIIQGIVATIGYAIFGVKDYALWGFLTGVCSMLPIVGTALIWIPLTLYAFATSDTFNAVGILIYAVVIISNIDYVARLTLLKRFMDIHPLVTIFGVIAGITLFGFWGVIFGPLLISYLVILIKIYTNEFGKST